MQLDNDPCFLCLRIVAAIEEAGTEELFQITINLPNKGSKVQVIVGVSLNGFFLSLFFFVRNREQQSTKKHIRSN